MCFRKMRNVSWGRFLFFEVLGFRMIKVRGGFGYRSSLVLNRRCLESRCCRRLFFRSRSRFSTVSASWRRRRFTSLEGRVGSRRKGYRIGELVRVRVGAVWFEGVRGGGGLWRNRVSRYILLDVYEVRKCFG